MPNSPPASTSTITHEARYRQLFMRSLAGSYQTNLAGDLVECNDAFARLFGYASREDCLRRWIVTDHLSAEQRAKFLVDIKQHRTLMNIESRYMRKDGTEVWVLENSTIVEGEDGRAG